MKTGAEGCRDSRAPRPAWLGLSLIVRDARAVSLTSGLETFPCRFATRVVAAQVKRESVRYQGVGLCVEEPMIEMLTQPL
jgi:hypothetical protein